MTNLDLYERVRSVPIEAKKKIEAGRLKGKTDINPMWRIKKLTEEFGPCGFGWYAPITEHWIEEGANGEKTANVRINLFVNMRGEWSKPIEGIGGSVLIAKETSGLRTDDDCFKKAYTDAISVACKALGFGGDVYWEKDPTKYENEGGVEDKGAQKVQQDTRSFGAKANEKNKGWQPITRAEMVEKYGVKNVEQDIVRFENYYEAKFEDWDKDITEQVRETLQIWKEQREEKRRKEREGLQKVGEGVPFGDV